MFAEVEPEPDEALGRAGVAGARRGSEPDVVVAVGGGSVIDAAKAMRLFHQHPGWTSRS